MLAINDKKLAKVLVNKASNQKRSNMFQRRMKKNALPVRESAKEKTNWGRIRIRTIAENLRIGKKRESLSAKTRLKKKISLKHLTRKTKGRNKPPNHKKSQLRSNNPPRRIYNRIKENTRRITRKNIKVQQLSLVSSIIILLNPRSASLINLITLKEIRISTRKMRDEKANGTQKSP